MNESYILLYCFSLTTFGTIFCCVKYCLINYRPIRQNNERRIRTLTREIMIELEEIVIDYSPYLVKVNNKDEYCSICLQTKNKGDIRMIRCTHSYHYDCINKWLNVKPICPDCRTSIK